MVNSASIARTEFSNRRGKDLCTSHSAPLSLPHTHSLALPPTPPLLAPGFEAAQVFLRSREIPDVWKMDMSQILDSSSSEEEEDNEEKESDEEEEEEEDHEEEEKKKKKQHIKEEVNKGHGEVVYRRLLRAHILTCLSISLRRSWTQRRGTTSCSSSTSSWKTEVGIDAYFVGSHAPSPRSFFHCL